LKAVLVSSHRANDKSHASGWQAIYLICDVARLCGDLVREDTHDQYDCRAVNG
jgi:hypothetical protein